MPRKRGVKRNKIDDDKIAKGLRKIEKLQAQLEGAKKLFGSMNVRSVTETNRDHDRQIAAGLLVDSDVSSPELVAKSTAIASSGSKPKRPRGKKVVKPSVLFPIRRGVRKPLKRSKREAALAHKDCNIKNVQKQNEKENANKLDSENIKKGKRKCEFKSKLLPGGKTVPLSVQISIVNCVLQEEPRGKEAVKKAKREMVRKHSVDHPGVHRQSINNWLKAAKAAPIGADLSEHLRNRGRKPDCDPLIMKATNKKTKERHESKDSVTDAQLPDVTQAEWNKARKKLKLPTVDLTPEKLNKFKDALGRNNTIRAAQVIMTFHFVVANHVVLIHLF